MLLLMLFDLGLLAYQAFLRLFVFHLPWELPFFETRHLSS